MSKPGTEWKRRVFGAGYVTPEQRRARDIDEAVREGLKRARAAGHNTPDQFVERCRTPLEAWPASLFHIRNAWREQHA